MDSARFPKTAPVPASQLKANTKPASRAAATVSPSTPAATQFAGGEERRRSQRVLLRVRAKVHIALNGVPTAFDVTTLNVNVHGALIIMSQSLPVEGRLVLEHCGTKERMACRVVRPTRETPEGFHIAIEFDSPAPDFWKIAFPPANWRPEDF
jgi:PilZ domain